MKRLYEAVGEEGGGYAAVAFSYDEQKPNQDQKQGMFNMITLANI